MEFRKAISSDVESVIDIIRQAQNYFKESKINQWQNNYPNYETINNDINNDYLHVLLDGDKLIGTVAIFFDGEETYDKIYDGEWLSNNKYAVIHRMAVHNSYKGRGISSVIIKHIEDMCRQSGINSIKVDTHKENLSMQKMLKKNGFKYCGIIYLLDGNERVAYEKLL